MIREISEARARMLVKHVFFASLLLNTEMYEAGDDWCPTACTDMESIWFNPKFIKSLHQKIVLFVLAHEVMHIVLKHGLRRGARDHEEWNIACDFFINLLLKKSGMDIWEKCYCDEKYDGMSSEQIYDERRRLYKQGGKPRPGQGQPGGPPGPGQPGYQGPIDKSKWGKGGQPDDGRMSGDGPLSGDVRQPKTSDPGELAEIERRINSKIAQAAQIAKQAGMMSGDMEHLVNGIINPPLPWQVLLQDMATKQAHEDESWKHRNRRFRNIYLPSRYSVRMGELVVIGDTSGSMMGSPVFNQLNTELAMIREQLNPERIRVIWADDAEVVLEQVFEPEDEVKLRPTGGGGTDMRRPLRHVEQFEPVVVIMVTDGYTPWPDSEPPFPLIVLCNTKVESPVGTTIHI